MACEPDERETERGRGREGGREGEERDDRWPVSQIRCSDTVRRRDQKIKSTCRGDGSSACGCACVCVRACARGKSAGRPADATFLRSRMPAREAVLAPVPKLLADPEM